MKEWREGQGNDRGGRGEGGTEKGKGGSEGEGERGKGVRGRERDGSEGERGRGKGVRGRKGERRNREEREVRAKERKGYTYKGRNTQCMFLYPGKQKR